MTICYFGIYKSDYSRNKVLITGLKMNGAKVIECNTNKTGIIKYLDLIKKHWRIRKDYDVMVVGFPGFQSVILAKLLTRRLVIFDAFLSIYDSNVLDRKLVEQKSWKAKYYWLLDKISMSIADLILFDTNEHIKYAAKEFKVPEEKFKSIFIGADTEIFFLEESKQKAINLKFYFMGRLFRCRALNSSSRLQRV